ncbi:MAG: metallophosphoesterase [Bacteroidetes bacterium]|nr:metallophosphoesterase [Bacteroidota bacterium]
MKTIIQAFIPLMLAGFVLPGEDCSTSRPHTTRHDGPYVLYKDNKVFVKYINDDHGVKKVQADSLPLAQKAALTLQVATDDPAKMFIVKLKSELSIEKTDYSGASKLYILSDIDGNFSAFKKLLLAGGIIDAGFNWTFGNGHLVLTGDFVDRGSQVNEVLWLIYSLEDKAKAAGGYVHYILGNHEIMNMNGDLRYVHPKYMESAGLLNEGFTSLYGENSELGRWLRTKNVMEKINDILFVHGGISAPVNRKEFSASKLNKLVRPHYADSLMEFKDPFLDTLYSDLGPFWYRGYYKTNPSSEAGTVDSTLRFYRVKKIATGHTVIADTISAVFDGKVINTDVHHVKGHSEALLVEDGKYYRVLPSGETKQLM